MIEQRPAIVSELPYRAEVDGLRAVAVLAVLVFHAGLACPGGFVGVDVFFVISGFLITSLIVKDLEAGTFTLTGFYERRCRRIVPALAAVVLATVVVGWFILLPSDYADLGTSTSWLALGGANFHFWSATGYFAGAAEDKPLLHTWSLAVEEQFYFIVPMALLLLHRIPGAFCRRTLAPLFLAGVLLSLAYSAYGVVHHSSATFYLLPGRSWELLLGSLLAVAPVAWLGERRWLRELLSIVGLVGILGPCFLYTRETEFPGIAAIPPCLGAFLLILANSRGTGVSPPTFVGGWLATKPLVFIGLISYSLYLWHWPIFAFSSYLALGPLAARHRMALVIVSMILAVFSWRLIETPFRRRTIAATRGNLFRMAAAGMALCMVVGVTLQLRGGVPERLPAALVSGFPDEPHDALMRGKEVTADEVRAGRLVPFGDPNSTGRPTMLIWGDSHAIAAMPAFDRLFKQWGLGGCAAAFNSTPPLVKLFARTDYGLNERSLEFNDAVIAYIEKERIPHAVMICAWDGYARFLERPVDHGARYEPVPTLDVLKEGILRTVQEIKRAGAQPWIVLQVPRQPNAKKIVRAIYTGLDERNYCTTPATWRCVAGEDRAFLERLETAGARIIDPRAAFLDSEQSVYRITRNGVSLYRDDHHLSDRGAVMTLQPLLEASFKNLHDGSETMVR
jgi:peptidoglycan/LPS O-acetylase OafA/YrhL